MMTCNINSQRMLEKYIYQSFLINMVEASTSRNGNKLAGPMTISHTTISTPWGLDTWFLLKQKLSFSLVINCELLLFSCINFQNCLSGYTLLCLRLSLLGCCYFKSGNDSLVESETSRLSTCIWKFQINVWVIKTVGEY